MSTTGDRIRQCREEHDYTLEELADKAGTTRQTIYKYEKNIIQQIPYDKLEDIANALHVTPAYLVGWTNDPYPAPPEEDFAEELNEFDKERQAQRYVQTHMARLTPEERDRMIKILQLVFPKAFGQFVDNNGSPHTLGKDPTK